MLETVICSFFKILSSRLLVTYLVVMASKMSTGNSRFFSRVLTRGDAFAVAILLDLYRYYLAKLLTICLK